MSSSGKMAAFHGSDTEGREYRSVEDSWKAAESGQAWYARAADYWEKQSADDSGMLGGYERISPTDIEGSRAFLSRVLPLNHLKEGEWPIGSAVDCGAGVGRTTRHLLHPVSAHVDLLEQSAGFLATAKTNLADCPRVRNFIPRGLQDHMFDDGTKYDLIFIQWVLLYLTDRDLVEFIKRALTALHPGGRIMAKENVTANNTFYVDKTDNSVTRAHAQYMSLFAEADAIVEDTQLQKGFPSDIFPVRMYLLKPKGRHNNK